MTQTYKRELPEGWRRVRLSEICELNPTRRNNLNRDDDVPTTFVPMSAVDDVSGTIARPEVKPFSQVKRGYTYFEAGDVLFAKITPCMQNGKQVIARNLIDGIGFGSTEFHVIRPSEQVISEWIHFYVRQSSLLNKATEFFTGAVGQQRLPESYLASLEIPLPPLNEQRRIAVILAEQIAAVDKARTAVESQLNAAKRLPTAYLREVFESEEVSEWETMPLGEVCTVVMGQSPVGSSYNSEGQGAPLLNGPTEFGAIHPMPIQWTTSPTKFCEQDDILLCVRGATTGRKNIADQRYCIGRGLAAIRGTAEKTVTEFLLFAFDFVTASILEETSGSTFPNLPGDKLERVKIPLPPVDEQRRIARTLSTKATVSEKLRVELSIQLDAINQLPAALLRRAFNGEL